VSLFDRFGRKKREKPGGPGPSAKTLAEIKDFIATREGVEAYLEPPTAVYAMTVCLVAANGEYLRRAVKDERQARQIATEHGTPLYDARKVGYPARMKDFDRGIRQEGVSLADLPPLEVTDQRERDD
jgi:hypothetical protein